MYINSVVSRGLKAPFEILNNRKNVDEKYDLEQLILWKMGNMVHHRQCTRKVETAHEDYFCFRQINPIWKNCGEYMRARATISSISRSLDSTILRANGKKNGVRTIFAGDCTSTLVQETSTSESESHFYIDFLTLCWICCIRISWISGPLKIRIHLRGLKKYFIYRSQIIAVW